MNERKTRNTNTHFVVKGVTPPRQGQEKYLENSYFNRGSGQAQTSHKIKSSRLSEGRFA